MMLDGELDRGCCDEAHIDYVAPHRVKTSGGCAGEHGPEVRHRPHNDRRPPGRRPTADSHPCPRANAAATGRRFR